MPDRAGTTHSKTAAHNTERPGIHVLHTVPYYANNTESRISTTSHDQRIQFRHASTRLLPPLCDKHTCVGTMSMCAAVDIKQHTLHEQHQHVAQRDQHQVQRVVPN